MMPRQEKISPMINRSKQAALPLVAVRAEVQTTTIFQHVAHLWHLLSSAIREHLVTRLGYK